jgi:hypothetical protein
MTLLLCAIDGRFLLVGGHRPSEHHARFRHRADPRDRHPLAVGARLGDVLLSFSSRRSCYSVIGGVLGILLGVASPAAWPRTPAAAWRGIRDDRPGFFLLGRGRRLLRP